MTNMPPTSQNDLFGSIPDRYAGDCTDVLMYELRAGADKADLWRGFAEMRGDKAQADVYDEIAGEIRGLLNDVMAAHL